MGKVKEKETQDQAIADRVMLPKYLKLNKGSMWFDTDGENCSGIKLYAIDKILVGRKTIIEKDSNGNEFVIPTEIPKDKFNNENLSNYGYIDSDLPWYVDISEIPFEKLSRVILAYKYGILSEADPSKPPKEEKFEMKNDFKINESGDVIFDGDNKEMYNKLQNLDYIELKNFIIGIPKNQKGLDNLLDLLEYEQKGHNALSRARFEVVELIRYRLKEFGPGISSIRRDDD